MEGLWTVIADLWQEIVPFVLIVIFIIGYKGNLRALMTTRRRSSGMSSSGFSDRRSSASKEMLTPRDSDRRRASYRERRMSSFGGRSDCSGTSESARSDRSDWRPGDGMAVNREIMAAAREGRIVELLQAYATEPRALTPVLIATAFYRCVLERRMTVQNMFPDDVLEYLTQQISETRFQFCPRAIGNAFHGLCRHSTTPGTRAVMVALAERMDVCGEIFSPYNVGDVLAGLHSQDNGVEEAKKVLRALAPHLEKCVEPFTSHDLGNAFYGLHRQGDYEEVNHLMDLLLVHLRQLVERGTIFEPKDVSKILHGIRAQTGTPQVKETLTLLTGCVKDKKCPGHFLRKHVSCAFAGLRGKEGVEVDGMIKQLMPLLAKEWLRPEGLAAALDGVCRKASAHGREVQKMLIQHVKRTRDAWKPYELRLAFESLPPHDPRPMLNALSRCLVYSLKHPPETFTAADFRSIVGGLWCLGDCEESRHVLEAVVKPLHECSNFSAKDLSLILHGLRGQGSDAAKAVVGALKPKLQECTDVFTTEEVANCFYGLRGLRSSTLTRSFIRLLVPRLVEGFSSAEGGASSRDISKILCGMRGKVDDGALKAVITLLESCEDEFSAHSVSEALRGFEGAKGPMTLQALKAFHPHVEKVKVFKAAHLVRIVDSVSGLEGEPEWLELIALLSRANAKEEDPQPVTELSSLPETAVVAAEPEILEPQPEALELSALPERDSDPWQEVAKRPRRRQSTQEPSGQPLELNLSAAIPVGKPKRTRSRRQSTQEPSGPPLELNLSAAIPNKIAGFTLVDLQAVREDVGSKIVDNALKSLELYRQLS